MLLKKHTILSFGLFTTLILLSYPVSGRPQGSILTGLLGNIPGLSGLSGGGDSAGPSFLRPDNETAKALRIILTTPLYGRGIISKITTFGGAFRTLFAGFGGQNGKGSAGATSTTTTTTTTTEAPITTFKPSSSLNNDIDNIFETSNSNSSSSLLSTNNDDLFSTLNSNNPSSSINTNNNNDSPSLLTTNDDDFFSTLTSNDPPSSLNTNNNNDSPSLLSTNNDDLLLSLNSNDRPSTNNNNNNSPSLIRNNNGDSISSNSLESRIDTNDSNSGYKYEKNKDNEEADNASKISLLKNGTSLLDIRSSRNSRRIIKIN